MFLHNSSQMKAARDNYLQYKQLEQQQQIEQLQVFCALEAPVFIEGWKDAFSSLSDESTTPIQDASDTHSL